jgi:hAT family C-terminal dimerisation region/Domain of unknown function (DUF4413)
VKKLICLKKLPDVSKKSRKAAMDITENCIFEWKLDNKLLTIIKGWNWSLRQTKKLLEKFQTKMLLDAHVIPDCFRIEAACYYYRYHLKEKLKKFGEDALEIAKDKGLSPINGDWLKGRPISWYEELVPWKFYSIVVKMLKEALLYKELFFESGEHTVAEKDGQGIDWEELEGAVNGFEAINPIIGLLFNFKHPTSNLYFQNYIKMHHEFATPDHTHDDLIENFPRILYVACVLDPRYKLTFLEYCFEKLDLYYGQERIDEVRHFFQMLLDMYAKEINQASSLSPGTTYKDPSTFIKRYPLYIKEFKTTGRSELNQYLGEEMVDIEDACFDLLGWWKENRSYYPVLSRMARDVLAIPACIYSIEEDLKLDLSVLQGASPELVEAVVCSKDWILSDVQR